MAPFWQDDWIRLDELSIPRAGDLTLDLLMVKYEFTGSLMVFRSCQLAAKD